MADPKNSGLCLEGDIKLFQTYDTEITGTMCPTYSVFFGAIGAMFAMTLSSLGAAYGTAKSVEGIAKTALLHPQFIVKSLIPVIMAGVGAIYGLVVAVLIGTEFNPQYTLYTGFIDLGAGLTTGITGLAAGYSVGVVGDVGVRMSGQNPSTFVAMILIIVFANVAGLYGLIISLTLQNQGKPSCHVACYNPCCLNNECAVWDATLGALQCTDSA